MVLELGTVLYVEKGIGLWNDGERAVVFTNTSTPADGATPLAENVRIYYRWPANPPAGTPPNQVAYAVQPLHTTSWGYGWIRGDKLYYAPSLTEFVAFRTSDTNMTISAKGKFMQGSTTTINYTLRHKQRNSSSWSSSTGNLTLSGDNWTLPASNISIIATSSYDIELTINDGKGSNLTFTQVIGTAGVPLTLGGRAVGVNAIADDSQPADLQIGAGGLSIDGVRLSKQQLQNLLNLL